MAAINFQGANRPPKNLELLESASLKQTLDAAMEQLASSQEPLKSIDQWAQSLSLRKLESAVKIVSPQAVETLQQARDLFKEAQLFLLETEKSITPSLKERFSALLESLLSVLESILSAFGLAEFFKPAESDMHADFKAQKIMMLVSFFTLTSSVLLPFVGASLAGAIIGGSLLSITALSLIYPHLRPTPFLLPHAANWSRQYLQGQLEIVEGRKKSVDEIALTLMASTQVKVHPLLIGKTGVGKTETAKALVQAIERGDYPELRGKKVFYLKMADLVTHSEMFSNNNRALLKIQEAIGRHGKKIILVFDEIHLGCQEREYSAIGEQLKTLLDPGEGNFPYVIGITTEEDYYRDIFLKQSAFARRFKRINIESTDESETLEILQHSFLKQAPKVLLEIGALSTLYQKTLSAYPERAQPAQSLQILSKCIQKTQDSQKSDLEKRIEAVRSQIHSFHLQRAVGEGMAFALEAPSEKEPLSELEATLRELEEQFQKQREELAQFFRLREQLAAVKTATFQTIAKIGKVEQGIFPTKELNRFLLLHHFLTPALKKRVLQEAARLGIQTTLDERLIDQVLQEEVESEKRASQIITQRKVQLHERAS